MSVTLTAIHEQFEVEVDFELDDFYGWLPCITRTVKEQELWDRLVAAAWTLRHGYSGGDYGKGSNYGRYVAYLEAVALTQFDEWSLEAGRSRGDDPYDVIEFTVQNELDGAHSRD